MQLRFRAALGGFAAFISVASPQLLAHASATQLRYQAPEGCPASTDFIDALVARGVEAQSASAPQVLNVSIEQTSAGFTGRLTVQDEQQATEAREASAATCAEVADAMAAVGALILAPRRASAELATAAPTAESAARRALPARSEPPATDSAPRDFRGASSFGEEARHWRRNVDAGTVHFDLKTSLNLNAGGTFGLLPGVWVPRFEFSSFTAPFLTIPGGEQSMLGVMPRVRIGMVGPIGTHISGQRVHLTGVDFHLGLCLSPHYDSRGWVLMACADYGGSMLTLDIGSAENKRTQEEGYANVALDFTAQYNFTPWLNVALRAGSEVYGGRKEIALGQGFGTFDLGGPATFSAFAGFGVNF